MKARKKRYCCRCKNKVVCEKDKDLKIIYEYYCGNYDENMFEFETYKSEKK